MEQLPIISWRQLTGNKFRKDIAPEMFTKNGCQKTQRIRQIGKPLPETFVVVYDKSYGLEFLLRKVCKVLSPLGKEKILELINEAWELYEKDCLNPHFVNEPID